MKTTKRVVRFIRAYKDEHNNYGLVGFIGAINVRGHKRNLIYAPWACFTYLACFTWPDEDSIIYSF